MDNGSQVPLLLQQIAGPVASFTGDGAYDTSDVYDAVVARDPDAAVVVPPIHGGGERDCLDKSNATRRHLRFVAELGAYGLAEGFRLQQARSGGNHDRA